MGYAKEGKQKGDLAGAASIIMPADTYLANMRSNILWETVVFLAIAGASVAVIAWLATRVNAARIHALEQDNRMKSDFLAMISHEVRTPLTSILASPTSGRRRTSRATPRKGRSWGRCAPTPKFCWAL